MSEDLLTIERVGRRFGERWVLREVSLRLRPGDRVALLGESGSGKSTLLNLIAGLEPVDEGSIAYRGQPLGGLSTDALADWRAGELGFVFQAFHLIGHLNLVQNVAVPLMLTRVDRDAALARAAQLLERLGLAGREASLPRELSGGEQQRVALARALAHRPRLVLADEPTGNLDPRTAASAIALMREQIEADGAALLMVTHSHQAASVCERRYQLSDQGLREVDGP